MSTPYNPAPEGERLPIPSPPIEPFVTPPAENPPWTFAEVVFLGLLAIFLVALFQGVAIAVALHRFPHARLGDLARNARVVLPAQIVAYLGVLAIMALVLRSRGLRFWKAVRWNWPSSLWVGVLAVGVLLSVIIQLSSSLLPIPKQLPIDQFFASTFDAYLLAIFGVTLAPLMEELYFRGFLYPVLARKLGFWPGVAITAAAFALIHASQLAHSWGPLLLLFIVGFVLTLARARTFSVGTSFLIHVGYNATLFTVMYFVTDHFHNLQRLQ